MNADMKEIDSYLMGEMGEAERAKFEDRFVTDDEFFVEVTDRENALIDRYVRNQISGKERVRFERTLAAIPSRRQKIENARVLLEFIADERPTAKTITLAERSGFSRFFSFGPPAFQFASIAVIAILAIASLLLLVENRRLASLRTELADARQRESDLSAQIEQEREASADLVADLDAERERIATLQEELNRARRAPNNVGRPVDKPGTTIATLVLSPFGFRGGEAPPKRLELDPGTERVSVLVGIPDDSSADSATIRLNGETIAGGARVRTRAGAKSIVVTVPAWKFRNGRNEIEVLSGESVIGTYIVIRAEPK